jgi:hypothetical protein
VWIGCVCVGKGTSGGLVWLRKWTFEFHKEQEVWETINFSKRTLFHWVKLTLCALWKHMECRCSSTHSPTHPDGQLCALAALTPPPPPPPPRGVKIPRYAFNRRLGEPHIQSGHFGKVINLCPCRESEHDSTAVQPVPQSLYRRYPGLQ